MMRASRLSCASKLARYSVSKIPAGSQSSEMTLGAGERLGALYICYLGLDEPLVQTQVIPYLEGLASSGHEIHLLTFEPRRPGARESEANRERLSGQGITWHWTRYHKRPSLPVTVFDAWWGGLRSAAIIRRHGLEVLHARAHVPAASALIAKRLTGATLVFDVRGLMAEEYADTGRWKYGGLPFRITKAVERWARDASDGIVVLTDDGREILMAGRDHENLVVVPCCVNTEPYQRARPLREEVRSELGLTSRTVVVYVGKFTGWYAEREMVDFYLAARQIIPDLHLMLLTQSDQDLIREDLVQRGLSSSDFTLTGVAPDEIPRMLSACDFGLSFVRPLPSKRASSPTKNAEYLAAGMPFIATAGVGGTDTLAQLTDVVVLLTGFEESEYERAACEVRRLLAEDGVRERCAEVASQHLSLKETGVPLYRQLYGRLTRDDLTSENSPGLRTGSRSGG